MTPRRKLPTVPESFVQEALQHIEETGRPLLPPPATKPRTTLSAEWDDECYVVSASPDDWTAPDFTWRDYAKRTGISLKELMEEKEFAEEELDEQLEDDILTDYIPSDEQPGVAQPYLKGADECLVERDGRKEKVTLVWYHEVDPWGGYLQSTVDSPLDLSMLQWVLNQIESGVLIDYVGHKYQ